jgi:hypothetical protein
MDVDLRCELTEGGVPSLLQRLGDDYYASEPAIRDAIRRKSCFNLIQLLVLTGGGTKVRPSKRGSSGILVVRLGQHFELAAVEQDSDPVVLKLTEASGG